MARAHATPEPVESARDETTAATATETTASTRMSCRGIRMGNRRGDPQGAAPLQDQPPEHLGRLRPSRVAFSVGAPERRPLPVPTVIS